VSNPGKPVVWAVRWCKLLEEELRLQGDMERQRGLPVTKLCDRALNPMPKSQLAFIKFIVSPTFTLVSGKTLSLTLSPVSLHPTYNKMT
jgi:hypothetical protein